MRRAIYKKAIVVVVVQYTLHTATTEGWGGGVGDTHAAIPQSIIL